MENTELLDNIKQLVETVEYGKYIAQGLSFSIKAINNNIKNRTVSAVESAQDYYRARLQQGDSPRGDWFPDFKGIWTPYIDSKKEFDEESIKQIISDSQGEKSKYIAYFHINIHLSSNDDIDKDTAFAYLEMINSLSWRQLRIIRFLVLKQEGKVHLDSLQDKQVEKFSKDQRNEFHAIGREYKELMQNGYIIGVSVSQTGSYDDWSNEPWLDAPMTLRLPYSTQKLHDLMNLNRIPSDVVLETFTLWNARLKDNSG